MNTGRIKNLVEEERPREKMLEQGIGSLTSSELIAILIRSGNSRKNAIDLAKEVMALADNRVSALTSLSYEKITSVNGIGKAKAISIIAAIELGKRIAAPDNEKRLGISSSETVYRLLSPLLKNLQHEEFWIIYLDRGNKVIKKERISSGGTYATVVDTKIIIKRTSEILASSVIIAHNHPSGTLRPGEQDKNVTRNISEALKYIDVRVLDHIIVAGDSYFSFADEGLL